MIKEYRLYIIFFVLLLAFVSITGFNGLYGQDSYEYLRFTNCLFLFYKTGSPTGDFFWPLLYPIISSLLSFIFKPVFALQLVSILSFIGAGIYADKTIEFIYCTNTKYKSAFVFLFFLLSPYLLRASLVVMSDMLSLFFVAGAYYYFFKYRKLFSVNHFIGFVSFAMAAVATRYAAFAILLIPACAVFTAFIQKFKWKALGIVIILACIIISPHVLLRIHHPLAFIQHDWITGWSSINFFKNSFVTADGNAHYPVCNFIYVFFNLFHPAFCFAGIVLVLFAVKYFKMGRLNNLFIPHISILVYALFLAGIPLQNLRFLLLSFPVIAIVLFPGFEDVMEYTTKRINLNSSKKNVIYVLIVFIQLGLFCRVFMPFYNDNKIEKQVAEEVLKHPNIPIYTFSIDGALRAYGVHNMIVNLYSTKLDSVRGEKLVLFNESQFADEWKGQTVMLNWQYIQHHFTLTKLEDLPDGWTLYTAP